MQKKFLALVAVVSLLLPVSVGARSLVNVSLGFGAAYSPAEPTEFSLGIQDPDNWLFGGEVSARLAFVQAQAMVFPMVCENDGQGVLLIGMGSLNLPILGSLLSLEMGAGASVTYIPSESSNARAYYQLSNGNTVDAQHKSFGEAMLDSPVYLQAGLASELGPIGISLRYLMESQTTLGAVLENNAWWSAFAVEKGTLSLALALKMF
ncbi:MAG: hypothetical protein AB7C91_06170 [Sphaerochaeta sp.]|uniref:hypothetical protein n=1 Tax=Sphaerochaeta sp. TaxID=1972642 RepID=UPI002FC6E59E